MFILACKYKLTQILVVIMAFILLKTGTLRTTKTRRLDVVFGEPHVSSVFKALKPSVIAWEVSVDYNNLPLTPNV